MATDAIMEIIRIEEEIAQAEPGPARDSLEARRRELLAALEIYPE